ncbi:nicotinamide mononucleotide transporter [Bacteroidaceae bacterium HV4-6-C5C]|nr:nicotinamide mononucleotide transporter [Bacteroidaceae bacterium HV4-6-C5C]
MEQTLEIIGTFVGLIYLWLEYRASIYLWIAGIIMPAIYLVVYYKAGLYADVGINIYYLLAAIYGWIVWRYGNHLKQYFRRKKLGMDVETATIDNNPEEKSDEELPITKVSLRKLPILTVAFSLAFISIALLLIHYTDSTVPWWDSFITALSIIGMWMLARKYIEQWLIWIVVDAISAALYLYKGLEFTAGLYAIYTIIAIFGYFKWKKLMIKSRPNQKALNN